MAPPKVAFLVTVTPAEAVVGVRVLRESFKKLGGADRKRADDLHRKLEEVVRRGMKARRAPVSRVDYREDREDES